MKTYGRLSLSTEFFAVREQDEDIEVGDIISRDDQGVSPPIVRYYHKSKTKIPYGISLNRVIEPNYARFSIDESCNGCRIDILRKGNIIYRLDFQDLPSGQPIYANGFNSKLTWKKLGPKVGILNKHQDKDGFCDIYVDFVGV